VSKETTDTPTITVSSKTRRILGLLLSRGTQNHRTLLRVNRQLSHTLSLHGTGLIHHATSCHISSSEIHSVPELHGSIQTELDSPNFYLPSRVSVITEREAQQLETIIPMDPKKLDYISTRVLAQKQTYDVDSLFQQHRTYMQHEEQTQWYMTLTTAISVAIFLRLLLFLVYSHFQKLKCCFFRAPNQNTTGAIFEFLLPRHATRHKWTERYESRARSHF